MRTNAAVWATLVRCAYAKPIHHTKFSSFADCVVSHGENANVIEKIGRYQLRSFRPSASFLRCVHAQGRVALLQVAPITLKALKRKETDFVPQSLGDHIRKRRLIEGITQKEVAKQLGVTQTTLINWEKSRTVPPLLAMSRVIMFLGYDPLPPAPKTVADRLKAKRRELGWSQRTAARQLGVDPCTWSDWETGGTIMARTHRRKVAEFVELPEIEVYAVMRKQWNASHGRPTSQQVKLNNVESRNSKSNGLSPRSRDGS